MAAWTATGRVQVNFDNPLADLQVIPNWNFGFLQFANVKEMRAEYIGRTDSDGSITIRPDLPPALTSSFGRDHGGTTAPNPPWTSAATTGKSTVNVTQGIALNDAWDHPFSQWLLVLHNPKSGYENYLVEMIDDREFVTIFAAKDRPSEASSSKAKAYFSAAGAGRSATARSRSTRSSPLIPWSHSRRTAPTVRKRSAQHRNPSRQGFRPCWCSSLVKA
jgi:hypothetical protein